MLDPILPLLGSAVVVGLLHTLIPDHWLPFVLIGRARRWSLGRTGVLASVSAAVHALVSIVLGLVVLYLGAAWAERAGDSFARTGSILLVVFGLAYAGWAWHKKGHFHPGGFLVHRIRGEPCDGAEGDDNPGHLHYHADDELILGRDRWGGLALALIVGINPCVVLLPILLPAAARGAGAVGLVVLAYAVPTSLLMVGLSIGGVAGTRRLRLPLAAQYMEMLSGAIIAVVGLFFLFGDHA